MTSEEKLDYVYEFCIRMEPVIKDVKELKAWKTGNGGFLPGAQYQIRAMWTVFSLGMILAWHRVTKGG